MVSDHFVLTPAESKRLIAKAVKQMSKVQRALTDGMIVICTGSTNAFVVEELMEEELPHYQYLSGHTLPSKQQPFIPEDRRDDVILCNGEIDSELDRFSALTKMEADDVFIKGANAVNYDQGVAGILIGGFGGGGTIGAAYGHIIGRRLNLLIPVGLEKCIAQDIYEVANYLNQNTDSRKDPPRMIPVRGEIVTEIEAISTLTGAAVHHIASGGIAGAEGGIRLLVRGTTEQIEDTAKLIDSVTGEPSFAENLKRYQDKN